MRASRRTSPNCNGRQSCSSWSVCAGSPRLTAGRHTSEMDISRWRRGWPARSGGVGNGPRARPHRSRARGDAGHVPGPALRRPIDVGRAGARRGARCRLRCFPGKRAGAGRGGADPLNARPPAGFRLLRQAVERDHALDSDEKVRAQRRLHASVTFLGMVRVDGNLDPETGQTLLTALSAVLDPESPLGPEGHARIPAQRRADALGEICRQWLDLAERPTVGGENPHVTVTVGVDDLRDGADGPGELDHVNPVQSDVARRLACDASIRRVVIPSEPLDVGRRTPVIHPAMRRAVIVRDRHCRFVGCDRRIRGAMSTTSCTGPTAGRRPCPIFCSCAGAITGGSINLAASVWSRRWGVLSSGGLMGWVLEERAPPQ